MSIESNEEAMLTAFARAASKAQEIEALLQEMLIADEVATDTKNRSFEEIAAEIEKLPLGPLKEKFLRVAQMADPLFPKMWKEINEERIFLMHGEMYANAAASPHSVTVPIIFKFVQSVGRYKPPFPIPKTQSAFRRRAQRNAFRHRDVRLQSRS
jgi:hypothetical protein